MKDGRLNKALAFIEQRAKALAVLSALFTLAGAFGSLYWLLELFSHFVVWYALLSIVAGLVLASRRRWIWVLTIAFLLSIQLSFPLAWYGRRGEDAAMPGNCTLLIANVLSQNRDPAPFLALIDEINPDVVCVQEVNGLWDEALESIRSRYPVHATVPRPDNFGIAVFSRLPGPIPQPLFEIDHGVPALALRCTVDNRPVSLLAIHALPPVGAALAARRNAQLESVKAWLASEPEPAVVVGDLNLTMYSPLYRRLIRDSGLQNARAGFGPLGTWPVWVPWLRLPLDHCLVTGEIEIIECRLGPDIGSDHLPLIVTLRVGAR